MYPDNTAWFKHREEIWGTGLKKMIDDAYFNSNFGVLYHIVNKIPSVFFFQR